MTARSKHYASVKGIGMGIERLLQILDEGAFITSEEMAALAKEVRAMQRDAQRYRWLKKYAGQLFMATENQVDAELDKAMHRREK